MLSKKELITFRAKVFSLRNIWSLKNEVSSTQFYFKSLLNEDMIACIVIPHKGNNFKWLLRIGFHSTFNKWGDVEYEDKFDNLNSLIDFMSNETILKEMKPEK